MPEHNSSTQISAELQALPWVVIRNPKASSGKGDKKWPAIEALLKAEGIPYKVFVTQHRSHASALAAAAIRRGDRKFLAVGGDGTVNEIANGLINDPEYVPDEFLLAQIPIGTGNDWGRTMKIPSKAKGAVQLLKNPQVVHQDVGKMDFEENGEAEYRYFINIAGLGYQAFVGEIAARSKEKGKGGVMAYVSALLSGLKHFKAVDARIEMDGKPSQAKIFSAAIGICNYNGGGMKMCPKAVIDDGLLDITMIHDIAKAKVIRNVPNLFTGKFIKHKEVHLYKLKELFLNAGPDILLEADGEIIGRGPARFTLLERHLRVVSGRA